MNNCKRESNQRQDTSNKRVKPQHRKEFLESGINPTLIDLNFESIEGNKVYNALCYSDKVKRLNNGRLNSFWLNRYQSASEGGWYCGTFNSLWGCFKPDQPVANKDKKIIKYEHPAKVETEVFRLTLPQEIIDKIFTRYYGLANQKVNTNNFWIELVNYPKILIIITEGAKKTASLLSQGYCAIGISGIFNSYKQPRNQYNEKIDKPYLKEGIKEYTQEGREFIIIYDNDEKPKTIKNVNKATFNLGILLKQEKCKVSIATPYQYKGIDDFIYNLGYEKLEELINNRFTLEKWLIMQKSRIYPDIKVNQRYLDLDKLSIDEKEKITESKLIALKSAKGTGKTEQLTKIVEDLIRKGKRVLLITHRIQLGRQLAQRFGLDYIDDVKDSETKGVFGYGLCIDSLHQKGKGKININEWIDCTIIIDESEQVISHLLTASTEVKTYRSNVIETLKDLLDVSCKIYLSDADLSYFSLNFISQLGNISSENTFILENKYIHKVNRKLISYQDSNPSGLLLELNKQLEKNKKILLLTTGQKIKSKWGSIQLELYFKQKYPELKILRIDSETVADPNHPSYGIMSHLNEIIKKYDLIIATPTIETGVSINKELNIDGVFGIFWGRGNSVNSVCQMLERYRGNCNRYVWINPSSIKYYGGKTTVNGIKKNVLQRQNLLISFLGKEDIFNEDDIDIFPIALNSFCHDMAKFNANAFLYRQNIERKLQDEGYILESDTTSKTTLKSLNKEVKENQQINYTNYCQSLKEAELLSYKEYLRLNKERRKTHLERLEVIKAKIIYSYFIKDIEDKLIEKHDLGIYSKLSLLNLLMKDTKYIKEYDIKRVEKIKLNNDNKIFSPDLIKDCKSNKVRILKHLDILQFLYRDDLSQDTLTHWHESMIIPYQEDIEEILGIKLTRHPVQVLKQLFEMVGVKLEKQRQVKINNKRVRIYMAYLDEISEGILENFQQCDRLQEKFNLERFEVIEFWMQNNYSFKQIESLILDQGTGSKNRSKSTKKQAQTVTVSNLDLGNKQPLYNNIGVGVPCGCSQTDKLNNEVDLVKALKKKYKKITKQIDYCLEYFKKNTKSEISKFYLGKKKFFELKKKDILKLDKQIKFGLIT